MSVYEGTDKYVFVSYAHKDSAIVVPMIQALQSVGVRVWYDEGIQAGTEWPAYIEDHLNNCTCVLICMSPSAVNSVNCRNEINYACMLKKDMLVVYLEETTLAKGMNLQLNSQQSLFRYRHSDDKAFIAELVKANILKPCKIDPDASTDDVQFVDIPRKNEPKKDDGVAKIVDLTKEKKPFISRVGTMGSNTPNNPWPTGNYSQSIEIHKFRTVHFHCSMLTPCHKPESRNITLQIFDDHKNLVFENVSKIAFNEGNDRFSIGWNIRDDMGLAQSEGEYTAIITVDDFRSYEYTFRLSATYKMDAELKEIDTLKRRLQYPKLYLLHLISSVCLIIGAVSSSGYNSGPAALFIIAWFVLTIIICRKTRKIVIRSRFLAFIFSFFGFFYYGTFLFIKMIITFANSRRWKARIAELESMM